jgi:hypothetical protein
MKRSGSDQDDEYMSKRSPVPLTIDILNNLPMLNGTSKQEIEVCAIISYAIYGPDYASFEAGHLFKLPDGLPLPDFVDVAKKILYQFDSYFFHNDRIEQDIRVSERHIRAGFSVVRLRDNLPSLPNFPGLTCIAVDAKDPTWTAVYKAFNVPQTPINKAMIADLVNRRLYALTHIPDARKLGLQWLQEQLCMPLLLKHFRLPLECAVFFNRIKQLFSSTTLEMRQLIATTCQLDDSHIDELQYWLFKLDKDKFVSFMCDGIAARLTDEAFKAELHYWFDKLDKKQFVTFMCNGIAARLTDEAFKAELHYWFDKLDKKQFVTFMCNGIAARLTNEAFKAELHYWFDKLGKDKFVSFMCDCIAARLIDEAFKAELHYWFGKLDKDKFVSFMCDGIAARLADEAFKVELHYWFGKLDKDKFVSFMCNGIAARLIDEAFKSELKYWFDKLGKDKFVTFMCNSIAARLTDEAFKAELKYWFDKLGKDKFVSFMCNSIAARLTHPAFRDTVELFLKYLTIDRCIALFSVGSFISRLLPLGNRQKTSVAFYDSIIQWIQRSSNPNEISTKINRIVRKYGAKRLDDIRTNDDIDRI